MSASIGCTVTNGITRGRIRRKEIFKRFRKANEPSATRVEAFPTLADVLVSVEPLQAAVDALPIDVTGMPMEPILKAILDLSLVQKVCIPVLAYYLLFAEPGPIRGILDFYILKNISKIFQRKFSVEDFSISNRLGVGNFGYVFEGEMIKKNGNVAGNERKKNRVILKQTRTDNFGVRDDFLYRGTIAQGAAETGAAEEYMCSLMQRSFGRTISADFMGCFIADKTERNFFVGQQWLVWRFESDATLEDFIRGKSCPLNMEELLFGREQGGSLDKRSAAVIKVVLKQVLQSLVKMHSIGLVHRDVKPPNLLITNKGKIKLIDFGAAADLRMGINYSPDRGMLDPDYSPPEQLVLPKSFPRAPVPLLAALLSPVLWAFYSPGKFDTYSAGCILLQLSVPNLRNGLAQFQRDIDMYDYDLNAWRNGNISASRYDFSLLDRNGGLAWDLACKLICNRGGAFGGRLSASGALRHPFFWVPDLS